MCSVSMNNVSMNADWILLLQNHICRVLNYIAPWQVNLKWSWNIFQFRHQFQVLEPDSSMLQYRWIGMRSLSRISHLLQYLTYGLFEEHFYFISFGNSTMYWMERFIYLTLYPSDKALTRDRAPLHDIQALTEKCLLKI